MRIRWCLAGLLLLLVYRSYSRPDPPRSEWDSSVWMERGLELERAGDLAGAEQQLLQAARVDHLYAPRWTLAGFYFRRDRAEDFWRWTRAALEVGTRELGALFQLTDLASASPGEVWSRAMPERREIWNQYLAYLLDGRRWEESAVAGARLAPAATNQDRPVLLAYCDLALEHGDSLPASKVWNGLVDRGLIASTAAGNGVVNGAFAYPPTGRGFDWRFPPCQGAQHVWSPGHLRLLASQHCDLLIQRVLLQPGNYVVSAQAESHGTALEWSIAGARGPVPLRFSVGGSGTALRLSLAADSSPFPVILRSVEIHRE